MAYLQMFATKLRIYKFLQKKRCLALKLFLFWIGSINLFYRQPLFSVDSQSVLSIANLFYLQPICSIETGETAKFLKRMTFSRRGALNTINDLFIYQALVVSSEVTRSNSSPKVSRNRKKLTNPLKIMIFSRDFVVSGHF